MAKGDRVIRFGEDWACECGRKYSTNDGYLAAHWTTNVEHNCGKCGRVHSLKDGILRLVQDKKKETV